MDLIKHTICNFTVPKCTWKGIFRQFWAVLDRLLKRTKVGLFLSKKLNFCGAKFRTFEFFEVPFGYISIIKNPRNYWRFLMELMTGLEPVTSALPRNITKQKVQCSYPRKARKMRAFFYIQNPIAYTQTIKLCNCMQMKRFLPKTTDKTLF